MTSRNTAKARLWLLCRKFVDDNRITCAESVYQTDHVIANAYKFVEEVCDVVGYHEDDDEAPAKKEERR